MEYKSLSDVTQYISRGITPSYAENEGMIVINQKCIRNNAISLDQARFHDLNKKKVPNEKVLRQYDILVNSTGVGTLGRTAQLLRTIPYATVDSHVTIVRPSDEIDPLFLGYVMKWREKNIESLAEGSTGQTELSKVRLGKEILVPCFDKPIQTKIGQLLRSLDAKAELNSLISENLEQQLKIIFQQWFISNADDNWEEKRIGDFLRLERGLSYKGQYLSEQQGVPMLNLGNILPNSVFRPEKLKFYTGEFKNKVVVSPGDIIVANTDLTQAREVLGSAIRVPELGYPTIICSHHISIVKDCSISKNFILGLLNMPSYRERVVGFATGTTVLALPNEALLNCSFKLPPDSLIKKYDDLANTYYSRIELHRKENKKLEEIRDSLLSRLLEGTISIDEVTL